MIRRRKLKQESHAGLTPRRSLTIIEILYLQLNILSFTMTFYTTVFFMNEEYQKCTIHVVNNIISYSTQTLLIYGYIRNIDMLNC